MSKPPINPTQTASGIAVDPQTLERVIPESRRPDGTVRKQIKIRPGFTPQEDVRRFRGTKQAQMDANTLPKGHIIGWVPPPEPKAGDKPMSKSAKKNAKRREKKAEEKKTKETVKDSWEDEDEDAGAVAEPENKEVPLSAEHTADTPNWAAAPDTPSSKLAPSNSTEALSSKMAKLDVR